jgi:hypothetical protein
MRFIRGVATSGLAVLVVSMFFVVAGKTGIAQASETSVTAPEDVLTYESSGCGGAIVQTPRSGEQFSAASLEVPDGAELFYAKAARLNVQWLSTMTCTTSNHRHTLIPDTITVPLATESIAPTQTSGNWSGYQISNGGQYVQSGWNIPTAKIPSPNYANTVYYDSAAWAGLGGGFGAKSTPLIQAGTEQDTTGVNGVPPYHFWYDVVTASQPEFIVAAGTCGTCLTANPGDDAGSVVVWTAHPLQSDPDYPGLATFGLCDFTQNRCVQFTLKNAPQPGNTVEWIIEAPFSNSGLISPLADFTSIGFYNGCWASTWVSGGTGNTCSGITSGTSLAPINMTANAYGVSQVVAYPGTMTTSTGFTDYYEAPQKPNNN